MQTSNYTFAAQFGEVNEAGTNFMVRCPGHNDKTPSLSISKTDVRKDGLPVYHCFAGCTQEHLKQVFKASGFHIECAATESCPQWDPTQISEQYAKHLAKHQGLELSDYLNNGVNMQVNRFFPALNKKSSTPRLAAMAFQVECLDGTPRCKYKSLYYINVNEDGSLDVRMPGDVKKKGKRQQATDPGCKGFFLAKNLRATPGDNRPCVNLRGEDKALICDKAGLRAVSATTGEGNLDQAYIDYLKLTGNTEVILIDDNDAAGMKGSLSALLSLTLAGIKAKAVLWPSHLPPKYDVNDYGRDYGLEALAKLPMAALPMNEFKLQAEARIVELEQKEIELDKPTRKNIGKIQSFRDLRTKNIKPVEWMIEGILPDGLTLLAGASKIGKTTYTMQNVLALCTGTDFMGCRVPKAIKVVFLNYDMSEGLLKDYMINLLSSYPEDQRQMLLDLLDENFYYIDNPDFQFHGPHFIEDMKALIDDVCPDAKLIVVDTLEHSSPAGQKSSANAYQNDIRIHKNIRKFHNETGLNLLFIHHTNKANTTDPFAKITGSTGITASYDTICVLDKDVSKTAAEQDYKLHFKGRMRYASDALPIKRTPERKWALNDLQFSPYSNSNY